jgi:CBS domain containing-hemolysin-like protein
VIILALAVFVCVLIASLFALAEASISRMTPVRALALIEDGYRNAALLKRIVNEPARYLNAIYLAVMFAQNGSAILVAILAEHHFQDIGITIVTIVFTLTFFVVVEAMSKTFAILHSDRVALALAPFVWLLGLALSIPARALLGLANVLLPSKGLKRSFVIGQEIRSLAEVGHQEGEIEGYEKEIIHSVFHFGDLVVRDIMVPRPDIIAVDLASSLEAAAKLIIEHGFTRIPAYRGDRDRIEGIVHAKDVVDLLYQGRRDVSLAEMLRPVRFVPDSKRPFELLREMQQEGFQLAIVTNEYGSVSGQVSLEDLMKRLVGQISDERGREAPDVTRLGNGRYRLNAALPIVELNEVLGVELPRNGWNTVGGLIYGLAGAIPAEGATVTVDNFQLSVERVAGRRIVTVLVTDLSPATPEKRPD